MLKNLIIGALFTAGTAFPAAAANSCWGTSDPPGCWLQCNFGGPCPIDWYDEWFSINIEIPNKGDAYQRVSELVGKQKLTKESLLQNSSWLKGPLQQTCKGEELLEVMQKTIDPQKIAKSCFSYK